MNNSLAFALISAILFSASSLAYTHFSLKITPLWTNSYKAIIAFLAFGVVLLIKFNVFLNPGLPAFLYFLISGALGLAIGDWFLLRAFAHMGTSRTLMVFSFGPIFIGIGSYFLLGQTVRINQILAIVLMMACLVTISYERYRLVGRWEFLGLVLAFIGVVLDNIGVLLSRLGFESNPGIPSEAGNFYRCLGAIIGFWILSRFVSINLIKNLSSLTRKQKIIITIAAFSGTFLALWSWLAAVKTGHLASISAVGQSAPLFAALFESAISKTKPNRYHFLALAWFALGIIVFNF